MNSLYIARMEQVKSMQENEYGSYTEIMDEKEVVRVTALVYVPSSKHRTDHSHRKEPRCVVHFYHPNFKRCEIMDKHLLVCLSNHQDTAN
jgi:hypothetical protein